MERLGNGHGFYRFNQMLMYQLYLVKMCNKSYVTKSKLVTLNSIY